MSVPASLSAILRVLDRAAVTIFAQDADLRYRWIENSPASWNVSKISGKTAAEVLPPAAAAVISTVAREVLSTGRGRWADLCVETDGAASFFDLYVEPERDEAGLVIGVMGVAIDVSDRRKQAVTLEAVARELSHRSKNLLAVIQSLATQTARAAPSPEAFIERFRGRIQSISRSQDLPIGTKRDGASLAALVETQVAPYVVDASRRVAFKGVDCHLSPNAALHVGLALYELCIASVQSGALSVPDGSVLVTGELIAAPTNGALQMTWRESDGPSGPEAEGFGKVLLERVVPAAVGGSARLEDAGDGRRYELTISAAEFE